MSSTGRKPALKTAVLTLAIAITTAAGINLAAEPTNYQEAKKAAGEARKTKNWKSTAEAWQKAVELAQKPGDKTFAYYRLGLNRYRARENEKALEAFSNVIENGSPNLKAASHYYMAFIYRRKKDYEKAIECFQKVINNPKAGKSIYENALIYIGVTYSNMQEPAKAEEYFGKAAEKCTHPGRLADLYYNWGNSLKNEKKYDKAIEKYEKVSSYEKASPNTKAASLLNKGYCYKTLKENNKALEAFNSVAEIEKARNTYKKNAQKEIKKLEKK